MLEIIVPGIEGFDDDKQEFFYLVPPTVLRMEHSLVSLSEWESKWCKPFLGKDEKTPEETLDYIKCMTLTEDVAPEVYDRLSDENVKEIHKYINSPMSATTFSNEGPNKGSREIITSELIYYWMVALTIPPEYQYWHLNRLITLIRICNIKNQPPKKRSKRDIMSRNAQLNAARRKQLNTNG